MRHDRLSQKDSGGRQDASTFKLRQAMSLVNQALEDVDVDESGHSSAVEALQNLEVAVERRLDDEEER